jgi:hypothetical protein
VLASLSLHEEEEAVIWLQQLLANEPLQVDSTWESHVGSLDHNQTFNLQLEENNINSQFTAGTLSDCEAPIQLQKMDSDWRIDPLIEGLLDVNTSEFIEETSTTHTQDAGYQLHNMD